MLIGADMATENRFYSFVLIFIVVVLGYLSYKTIYPFLSPIMWAIVLSLVFYPVYAFILKYVKYKSVASVLTLLVIILILIGPFSYFAYVLTQELVSLVNHIQSQNGNPNMIQSLLSHPLISSVVQKLLAVFRMTEQELYNAITDSVVGIAKQSTGLIKSGFGNIVAGGINFVSCCSRSFSFSKTGRRSSKRWRISCLFPADSATGFSNKPKISSYPPFTAVS